MVKPGGKLILLGAPEVGEDINFNFFDLIWGNKTVAGSVVGPRHYYPDMLAMSANLNIVPTIETIPFDVPSANANFTRLAKGEPTLPRYSRTTTYRPPDHRAGPGRLPGSDRICSAHRRNHF